jgi:hypothetical protein
MWKVFGRYTSEAVACSACHRLQSKGLRVKIVVASRLLDHKPVYILLAVRWW